MSMHSLRDFKLWHFQEQDEATEPERPRVVAEHWHELSALPSSDRCVIVLQAESSKSEQLYVTTRCFAIGSTSFKTFKRSQNHER